MMNTLPGSQPRLRGALLTAVGLLVWCLLAMQGIGRVDGDPAGVGHVAAEQAAPAMDHIRVGVLGSVYSPPTLLEVIGESERLPDGNQREPSSVPAARREEAGFQGVPSPAGLAAPHLPLPARSVVGMPVFPTGPPAISHTR